MKKRVSNSSAVNMLKICKLPFGTFFIITSVNITIRYLSKTFLILNLLFNENKSESQGLLPAF